MRKPRERKQFRAADSTLTCEKQDALYAHHLRGSQSAPGPRWGFAWVPGVVSRPGRCSVSFLSSLLAWANAPFTVALGVALGFAVLQMTGLLGLFAGGGDHEGDADHE